MVALNKRTITVLSVVGLLLLIPLIAMQFTTEVNWKFFDFLVAGALLLGAGFAIEYSTRKLKKKSYLAVIVILIILLLVWAELAVGIFGTPFGGS